MPAFLYCPKYSFSQPCYTAFPPFDLIPELLLPHIGWGEDVVLIILAIRNLIAASPPDIVRDHARNIAKKKKA